MTRWKIDAVVEAVARELDEVLDGLRRVVVEQLDLDRAVIRVQRRGAHVAQPIRERLDRAGGRRELAGLEALDDLAQERERLAVLVDVEHGVHRGEMLGVVEDLERDGVAARGPGRTSRRGRRRGRGRRGRPAGSRPLGVGCAGSCLTSSPIFIT